MVTTISKQMMDFLKDHRSHNNKAWFEKNREKYDQVIGEFEVYIDSWIIKISRKDPKFFSLTGADCIPGLQKGSKQARDKGIFQPFNAIISSAPKGADLFSKAGYYLHIEPGQSYFAAGAFDPDAKWLESIRKRILKDPLAFEKIINRRLFVKAFGELAGEKMKSTPPGYPSDLLDGELIKYKSYFVKVPLSDQKVLEKSSLKNLMALMELVQPLIDFLNNNQGKTSEK